LESPELFSFGMVVLWIAQKEMVAHTLMKPVKVIVQAI
jgi:hypothetical protein